MSLRSATEVVRIGPTRWSGTIEPGWDIAGNANGGYLTALAGRALLLASGRPDPVTVTAHFMAPGQPGAVEISTQVLKEGSRFATVQAVVEAQGKPLIALLGTFGDLSGPSAFERVDARPPELADLEDCIEVHPTETFPPPFMGKIELRLDPDDTLVSGIPSPGVPTVRGWFRLRDHEPVDTTALLVAVDAFPPTAFSAQLPVAWTPTLEMTTHVRRRPAPGWLRCQFTTRFMTGGFLEEDGEVWDSTGALVAQSRQLALIPRSRP